jgi:acetamidase/formamidase
MKASTKEKVLFINFLEEEGIKEDFEKHLLQTHDDLSDIEEYLDTHDAYDFLSKAFDWRVAEINNAKYNDFYFVRIDFKWRSVLDKFRKEGYK